MHYERFASCVSILSLCVDILVKTVYGNTPVKPEQRGFRSLSGQKSDRQSVSPHFSQVLD